MATSTDNTKTPTSVVDPVALAAAAKGAFEYVFMGERTNCKFVGECDAMRSIRHTKWLAGLGDILALLLHIETCLKAEVVACMKQGRFTKEEVELAYDGVMKLPGYGPLRVKHEKLNHADISWCKGLAAHLLGYFKQVPFESYDSEGATHIFAGLFTFTVILRKCIVFFAKRQID